MEIWRLSYVGTKGMVRQWFDILNHLETSWLQFLFKRL